MNTKLAMNSVR